MRKKPLKKFLLLLLLSVYASAASAAYQFEYKITGISDKPLENAQQALQALTQAQKKIKNPSEIKAWQAQAPKLIYEALNAYGYFDAKVQGKYWQRGNTFYARFTVNPGRPIRIDNLQITITGAGHNDKKLLTYRKTFPLKKGDIFVSPTYETAKKNFFTQARNHGYLSAKFTTRKVVIDRAKFSAQIELAFDTGPRYRFGPIIIENPVYRRSFIERFIPFKTGDHFAPNRLISLQRSLSDTEFFEQANVIPDYDHIKHLEVPVHIHLKPRKSRQYSFGLGYGTDTGPRGTFGFNWWHITDTGHHIKSFLQFSQIRKVGNVSYLIPGKNPKTDQYALQGAVQSMRIRPGDYDLQSITASYSHLPKRRLQRTISLSLQNESSRQRHPQRRPRIHTFYLIPQINYTYISTDRRIDPRRGYRLSGTVSPGLDLTSNQAEFIKYEISAKFIQSLNAFGKIILRGRFGFIQTTKINLLPLSVLFMTGGPQSVRGYNELSIGPGRYLKEGSVEYQYPVYRQWYLVGFMDAGNASDKLNDRFFQGTGGGVGYQSKIGPIQLTVAQALNRLGSHRNKVNVQFTLGPDL